MIALGVEVLLRKHRSLLSGKKVGLVTNYTATDSRLRPVVDLLTEDPSWQVTKLFGPEHGMRNSAKEGEHVTSEIDIHTGLRAYSLYGDTRKPTAEMLEGIDVLVIDLHDIGSRYYTNMNTMAYCMEACAETNLPCIVLDRPNPINGVSREGNILSMAFSSFVGMFPIPNRHGLTMGEIAFMQNERLGGACNLTVIAAEGWERNMMLSDTGIPFVPSSPNTTNLDMVLLYPGTCLFEGVNLSLGRGTTHPFEVVGAPFLDGHQIAKDFNQEALPGVAARPCYFVPLYSQYIGELCCGIQLHVLDPRRVQPVKTGLTLMQVIANRCPNDFRFLEPRGSGKPFIDLLAGTDTLRTHVLSGQAMQYLETAKADLEAFDEKAKQYTLYPS